MSFSDVIYNSEFMGIARIGNIILGKDAPQIFVINLANRIDRKEKIILELTKWRLPFSFYIAQPHTNPVRGCLESHINIIKYAKEKKYSQICIFEDDLIIHNDLDKIMPFPLDWDMIFLGGLVTEIYDWGIDAIDYSYARFGKEDEILSDKWIRGRIYCAHAYIVKDTIYDIIINEGWEFQDELDRFYTSVIHPIKMAYVTYVQHITQYNDWSDIEKREKWNNFLWPKAGEMFNLH